MDDGLLGECMSPHTRALRQARPLSGRQLADLKASIVALMQPRETVPMLLKRLGGARGGKGGA